MSVEQDPEEIPTPKPGLLRRFSRSSGRSSSAMAPMGENSSPDATTTTTTTSTTWLPVRSKLTAFARLKSQLGRRGKKSKVKFPPSSWNAGGSASEVSNATTSESTHRPTLKETTEPTSDEAQGTKRSVHCGAERASERPDADMDASPDTDNGNPNADDPQLMSAATLARRIQTLLSSLPPFYTLSSSGSLRLPKSPSDQGNSEPDTGAPLADSKFLSLLSSASAMNGSISKGRESVWAILERLGYSPNATSGNQTKGEDEPGAPSEDDNVEVSSVMICCPLEPTADTEVEIARSEIVSIDIDETAFETALTRNEQKSGLNLWPFGKGKGKETVTPEPPKSAPPKVKEVRVWFPSRTKVSLQAAWWGYRIYLPPPVMRVLSDKTLEAAKRAAMITTALTWLVSRIPTAMLPPQLKAVVGIVKGIVPIIGYVGGFIAWSWSTIQSFDKGQGVILSATWLLPIALVPGTWQYTEPPSSSSPGGSSGGITPGAASPVPPPPPKDPPAEPVPPASTSNS